MNGISLDEKKYTVFNFQQFSIQDGPGMRTTMFVKGCPLKCPWCSNPESINRNVQIKISPDKCRGCGECQSICTKGAIHINKDKRLTLDYNKCSGCLLCIDACRFGNIRQVGFHVSVKSAVHELLKDRDFYRNTKGGITISGGEPLAQPDFTKSVFKWVKVEGVHTTLDTTGCAPWDVVDSVTDYVDLVYYDIKHLDPDKHRKVTGVDNRQIIENLQKLSGKIEICIRVPLIPGFNAEFELADKIIELAKKAGAKKIFFLPLHKWGEHKYDMLGLRCNYNDFTEFLPEEIDLWKNRYRKEKDFVVFE